jgi:hypothetical protein
MVGALFPPGTSHQTRGFGLRRDSHVDVLRLVIIYSTILTGDPEVVSRSGLVAAVSSVTLRTKWSVGQAAGNCPGNRTGVQ